MIDVTVLHTHKKTGVFSVLLILTLAVLAASMPALQADPGFTLEGVRTWYWNDGARIFSIAYGDVDGDGATEIVTGGDYDDGTRDWAQLCVWDGATLALEGVTTWYWVDSTVINSVAVGDVHGDGQAEIVTGGYYYDGTRYVAQLCVWNGSTLALEGVTTWYWVRETIIESVACGDVDGDGEAEIVTGGYHWDGTRGVAQLCVWSGSLGLEDVRTWYWTGHTRIVSVACADVDGDGQTEIVTGGRYDDGTREVAQLAVWDGATLALEDVTTWYQTGDIEIESVACGDVDGDAQREIVTGGSYYDDTRYNAQLAVWDNTLSLQDETSWYWTSHTHINSVAIADVDGDGSMDIVTGGYYYDGTRHVAQLCVWNGSTLSLEGVTTWYWVDDTIIKSMACGDVDGDGATEIVTGGWYDDSTRNRAQLCVWNGAT